ncbi:putative secreted protein [Kutzneria albida DSM 43870]|uniref:Putative secreted protein n=1 Tax=Kutzneria albida DSM 43870 TaxID=1449976 RepID=W5WCI2_9PSEU|nr:putative secreted protein [Kutzneria albida DSM 43870]
MGRVRGRGVPGWGLRAAVGVVGALIVLVLAVQGVTAVLLGLVGFVAVAAVALPGSPAAMLLIGVSAVATAVLPGEPLRWEVLVLIPLVHLLHLSCALAAILPRGGRLHLAALRAPVRRFAFVQAGAFGLAGLVALLPSDRADPVVEALGLLGAAGLVLLVAALLRDRDRVG